ncbi:MAG: hypothetical protein UIG59_02280, partial [Acutalibacteraceae bacterium]|nr:hypothetical protein [Acutalibacteraceae bacterium]
TDEKAFDEVTLVVYMPETVGNEANYKNGAAVPTINLGLNLVATQDTVESDSFGIDYDEFAQYPNKAELLAKLNRLSGDDLKPKLFQYNENGGVLELDTGYGFQPTQTLEEALASDYAGWHADFVVYADKEVKAESLILAGYYKAYCDLIDGQWVGMTSPTDIPANNEVRLLFDGLGGTTINYEEICRYGNDGTGFLCGAADVSGQNVGTTLTVELRLYETKDPADTETNTANEETGEYIIIGTYEYTF